MTEFCGIKVVRIGELREDSCIGCIVYEAGQKERYALCETCHMFEPGIIYQPESLIDNKHIHVVLTGGRKPSFPIKAGWSRGGTRYLPIQLERWDHQGKGGDIIAVERAGEN